MWRERDLKGEDTDGVQFDFLLPPRTRTAHSWSDPHTAPPPVRLYFQAYFSISASEQKNVREFGVFAGFLLQLQLN